jgi:AcrR family transcriptional regulator
MSMFRAQASRASIDGRMGPEASDRRRTTLVKAALKCFTDAGYERTCVSDIIGRAGATIGTFYHYFPRGKAQIAAAVQLRALAGYQSESLEVLKMHPGAREGIQAGVRNHLRWVSDHPLEAQFLFSSHPVDVRAELKSELSSLNRRYFQAVDDWLAGHVEAGLLRDLPRAVAYALWVGPAQQIGRQHVGGGLTVPLNEASNLLAEGAWEALRRPTAATISVR